MKGMRVYKRQQGGYLSALEKSRPELFKTISGYRSRLSAPEQQTFDKRANIQYAATQNMPTGQRDAYIKSIEQKYAKPSDEQFSEIQEGLKSKRFTPVYSYYDPSTSTNDKTTGYYRDLTPEIEKAQKELEGLTFTKTEEKTRPQYEVTYPSATTYGSPRPSEMTTDLPKDAVLTRGLYGQEYLQSPIQNRTSMGQTNLNPQYRQVGSQKYTETTTRPARAGDPEYDKKQRDIKRLQTRHNYRGMYGSNTSPLTSANVYQQMGLAKKGGSVKVEKFTRGGGIAVRGKNFSGVK